MWAPSGPPQLPRRLPRPSQAAVCLRTHCLVIVLFIAALPAVRPLAAPWPLPSCWFVTLRLYLDSSILHSRPFLLHLKSDFAPGSPVTATNPVLSTVPLSVDQTLFLRLFFSCVDRPTDWCTNTLATRSIRSNSPTQGPSTGPGSSYGTVYF